MNDTDIIDSIGSDINIADNNVKDVYNIIANHFDVTRAYLWKSVKKFLKTLKPNSFILDAGCGNGKNMFRNDCFFIGIDNSIEMIKICQKKNLLGLNADLKAIPFRDNYFDVVICIAVIHHIPNIQDRIKSIEELLRVTKKGGKLFIQLWDDDLSNRKTKKYHKMTTDNDYLIEWQLKDKIYYRYYHLFSFSETKDMFSSLKNSKIIDIYNECQNWIVIIEKI